MPIFVECEKCGTKFRIADRAAGKTLKCKECGHPIRVPRRQQAASATPDSSDDDSETYGIAVAPTSSTDVPPPRAKYPVGDDDQSLLLHDRLRKRQKKRQQRETTWVDILRSPFEVEVLATATSLVINYLIWAAGYLCILFGGFCLSCIPFLGMLVVIVLPIILLVYGLRMIAMFFEEYFMTCRRSALETLELELQTSWQRTLGFTIGVFAFAMFPVALCILAAETMPKAVFPLLLGGWLTAYVWAALYAPMGIAVAAIKESLDPRTVVTWVWKCMPDYLLYFAVASAYYVVVALVYLGILLLAGLMLPHLGEAQKVFAPFTFFFTALLTMFVGQFVILAQFAMLGALLRRHAKKLRFEDLA